MHCVDLDESFQTHIYLQNLALIQPRTSPAKFAARAVPPSTAFNSAASASARRTAFVSKTSFFEALLDHQPTDPKYTGFNHIEAILSKFSETLHVTVAESGKCTEYLRNDPSKHTEYGVVYKHGKHVHKKT